MSVLKASSTVMSVVLHGVLILPFISFIDMSQPALDAGTGTDDVRVEQGIALEGLVKLGDAEQSIETVDIQPVTAAEAAKPVQVQPVEETELRDVISSPDATTEAYVVDVPDPPDKPKPEEVKEKPPEEVKEKPKPKEMQALAQPQQVAVVAEQSSGVEKFGGNTTLQKQYLGQVRLALERSKVNPRSSITGTVKLRFTVDSSGEIVSREITASSGSKLLDDAALASLDRATPLPAMPTGLAGSPLVVEVPFKFLVR